MVCVFRHGRGTKESFYKEFLTLSPHTPHDGPHLSLNVSKLSFTSSVSPM